jgi:ribosome-binding factor A
MRIRPEKVAHLMRREVAEILQQKLRDPRVSAMVSVTDVEVTQDLSYARVFVSIMGSPAEREATMRALAHAAGFVRHELSPRLGLREVPEVRFVHDDSLERGARVDELLKRIHDGESPEDGGEDKETR